MPACAILPSVAGAWRVLPARATATLPRRVAKAAGARGACHRRVASGDSGERCRRVASDASAGVCTVHRCVHWRVQSLQTVLPGRAGRRRPAGAWRHWRLGGECSRRVSPGGQPRTHRRRGAPGAGRAAWRVLPATRREWRVLALCCRRVASAAGDSAASGERRALPARGRRGECCWRHVACGDTGECCRCVASAACRLSRSLCVAPGLSLTQGPTGPWVPKLARRPVRVAAFAVWRNKW